MRIRSGSFAPHLRRSARLCLRLKADVAIGRDWGQLRARFSDTQGNFLLSPRADIAPSDCSDSLIRIHYESERETR